MMRILKYTFLFFTFISVFSCIKEAEITSRSYPFVKTGAPVVKSGGVELTAELLDPGKQKIIQYGFVWNTSGKPNLQDNREIIEGEPAADNFSIFVDYALEKDQMYFVRAFVKTENFNVFGNEVSFVSEGSLPPVITGFAPDHGPIGTQVTIYGSNFALNKNLNIVKFGDVKAIMESVSKDELVVRIPEINRPELVNISVETAGMVAESDDSFDLWFPWKKKNDFSGTSFASAGFSIGNIGYVINYNRHFMLTYDPVSDTWESAISLPENSGNIPMAFVMDEKAYVLLNNHFWLYDPSINTWEQKQDFPGFLLNDRRRIFNFSIGHKLYVGNCWQRYDFWEYDTHEDSWQRKNDFSGNLSDWYPVVGNYTFSLNNQGFLGISQSNSLYNTLWKYNPEQDSWAEKTRIPVTTYNLQCVFIIDDKAYVGLGRNSNWYTGYVFDEIWMYDYPNDQWIKYRNCPVHMAVKTSFVINNKGYLVSGYTYYYNSLHNVWEFDPAKN
jgi:hypothetical protein